MITTIDVTRPDDPPTSPKPDDPILPERPRTPEPWPPPDEADRPEPPTPDKHDPERRI
jgi:hypothetical protein